jgi:hypothetical protein
MPPIASPVTTAPGAQAYSGGVAFNLPMIGTMYSTNITPDKETGIGNYTDQQFLDALHRASAATVRCFIRRCPIRPIPT